MKTIHYIACDSRKYAKEAEVSAFNFKKNSTQTRIILYTDLNFVSTAFDEVVKIDNLIPGGLTSKDWCEGKKYFESKIKILSETQSEYNLYLDGDIKTLINIDSLFSLLERFDLAVSHDTCRSSKWSDELGIPLCFPDFNLGMLFYKKSTTAEFFKSWAVNFQLHPQPHDQPSFRKTVWNSNMRVATLPPEFNNRPKKFWYKQDLAIIHGRGPDGFLPEIDNYENRNLYI